MENRSQIAPVLEGSRRNVAGNPQLRPLASAKGTVFNDCGVNDVSQFQGNP